MWSVKPSLFAEVVTKDTVKLTKDIATDMFAGINDLSPIDTSNFVSNNNVSIGEPNYTYHKDKKIGRGGARAEGMRVIDGLPDDKIANISIANGTPYGQYLEGLHGTPHSRQAPNGVYRVTYSAVMMWYR